MPRTRRLLKGEITYSQAKELEVNILHQLGYYDQKNRFFSLIDSKRPWIKGVVAHHLGLRSTDACHVADMEEWFCGSFNVCVPVIIDNWTGRQQVGHRVLLRFPLPYRIGEDFRHGNGDEKIQCEAGSYAWLEENCPDVPIPRLYGFAMSTGETFTRIENLPFLSRCFQYLRRTLLSIFGLSLPSCYCRHSDRTQASQYGVTGAGYMLVECIEQAQGEMLSNTWSDKRHDVKLRANLFRDLSRILLSISRLSLPQIGSFVIDCNGFLRLNNRPLSIEIQQLENEKIPTHMPRNYTYSTVESYVTNMLGIHDSRLQNQPNAVNNLQDCASQMGVLAAMRTIFPLFFQQKFCRGPFIFTLTDLHQSNIFVDDDWHITSLVDLEWACSRPIETVNTPHWLSGKGVDEIDAEEYNKLRTELMTILAAEETNQPNSAVPADAGGRMPRLSETMEQAWVTGTFWYSLALSSPTGLFGIFYERILPLLTKHPPENFGEVMPFYWVKDVGKFVADKLSDKKKYDHELWLAFGGSDPK